MKSFSVLCIALLVAMPILRAVDPGDVATFDRFVINPDELFFEEDTRITPDRAFIVLRNYRMLSNPKGERFAMVTIQNQLNSRQILDEEEFVGIFANGDRMYPREFDISLDPERTRTLILRFGAHPYPLVKLLIEND